MEEAPCYGARRETIPAQEELELEVSLISGQTLAKVRCRRSEGLGMLRKRVTEACKLAEPCFSLVHDTKVLRKHADENPLDSLPDQARLVLLKQSASQLSDELVGFHGAAYGGDHQKVRLLVEEGAEVDHRDRCRLRTALMWAAAAGHVDICSLLLEHGANPTLRASGASAAQVAEANGHAELARLLREMEWQQPPWPGKGRSGLKSQSPSSPRPTIPAPSRARSLFAQAVARAEKATWPACLMPAFLLGLGLLGLSISQGPFGIFACIAIILTAVVAGSQRASWRAMAAKLYRTSRHRCGRRRSRSSVAPMPTKPMPGNTGLETPALATSGCRRLLKAALDGDF